MKTEKRANVLTIAPDEFDEIVFDILEDLAGRFADSDLPQGVAEAVGGIVAQSYGAMYKRLFGGREDHYAD